MSELGAYFGDGTATVATGDNLTRGLRHTAEELARAARPLFAPLLRERILDRPEISNPVLLKDVRDKSAVMIGLNRHAGLTQLTGNNEVDLVFFEGAKTAANAPDSKAHELHQALENLKTPGITMRFEESPSPQELLCVRVLGGFSLAMISGFQPPELEGNNFRQSFEVENAEKFNVYSRTGIKWQPFDGDRDHRAEWRQGLILTGLCFSRTGNMADCLVVRTDQGYMYRPPRPLGPGRDRILLPFDLREAANALREQPEFMAGLEDDIKRVRVAKPVDELASYLEWLYDNSENLNIKRTANRFSLRYEDSATEGDTQSQIAQSGTAKAALEPVTSAQAFDLIRNYWRNDSNLLGRLNARYAQQHLPAPEPVIAPFPGQVVPPPTAATGAVAAPVPEPISANVAPFPGQNASSQSAPPAPSAAVPDDLDFV